MAIYVCAICNNPRADDVHGYTVLVPEKPVKEVCDGCLENTESCNQGHHWDADETNVCPECGPSEAQLQQMQGVEGDGFCGTRPLNGPLSWSGSEPIRARFTPSPTPGVP